MKDPTSDNEPDEIMSVAKLKNHIRQNHCKETNEKDFSLFENIGDLVEYEHGKDIPPILKEIGLGASLYLLTLKAFTKLFLVLLLINVPMIVLYFQSENAFESNISAI